MLSNTNRWLEVRGRCFPTGRKWNVIGVTNRDIMPEIANNSRAHVTEGRSKGIVITMGVVTVAKGNLIGYA